MPGSLPPRLKYYVFYVSIFNSASHDVPYHGKIGGTSIRVRAMCDVPARICCVCALCTASSCSAKTNTGIRKYTILRIIGNYSNANTMVSTIACISVESLLKLRNYMDICYLCGFLSLNLTLTLLQ